MKVMNMRRRRIVGTCLAVAVITVAGCIPGSRDPAMAVRITRAVYVQRIEHQQEVLRAIELQKAIAAELMHNAAVGEARVACRCGNIVGAPQWIDGVDFVAILHLRDDATAESVGRLVQFAVERQGLRCRDVRVDIAVDEWAVEGTAEWVDEATRPAPESAE